MPAGFPELEPILHENLITGICQYEYNGDLVVAFMVGSPGKTETILMRADAAIKIASQLTECARSSKAGLVWIPNSSNGASPKLE